MDSIAAAGRWGTGATAAGGGGGGGASLSLSYGRDEKILTAAAAGLGASLFAAFGLFAGVMLGCGNGIDDDDRYTQRDKNIESMFRLKLRKDEPYDTIDLEIAYSVGRDTSETVPAKIMVPKGTQDVLSYIETALREAYNVKARPTGLSGIDVVHVTDSTPEVTLVGASKEKVGDMPIKPSSNPKIVTGGQYDHYRMVFIFDTVDNAKEFWPRGPKFVSVE